MLREEAADNGGADAPALMLAWVPATVPAGKEEPPHRDVIRDATGISVIQALKGEYGNEQD